MQGEMIKYLLNAFSLNMLAGVESATLKVEKVADEVVRELLSEGFESAVGHEATAYVLSQRLGIDIPTARVNIALCRGEAALVAQVGLPRLAEGQVLTSEQVVEAPITFYLVRVT